MEESHKARKKSVPNRRLKEARVQRGWTLEDVATSLNLSDPHMVGRWERGLHLPQPYYRRQLAKLFGKSLEELDLLGPEVKAPLQLETSDGHDPPCLQWWNVPPTFTSLLAREKEITAVCALLRSSERRLITLWGPGGVGKTHLAIQIAREMRAFFKNGVCFISLAEVEKPDLVSARIAEALGIWNKSQFFVAEQIRAVLADKQCLLILDNFERLTPAVPFLEKLLATCEGIKILVTSRLVLHLSAEHLFPVLPLALPESIDQIKQNAAVILFLERARAAGATFQVTPEKLSIIRDICAHLDGLPLAIELAAAQVKMLPPALLLTRLAQRFQLLTSELHDLPERHRTLYKTISWSYDLLTPQEQWLYRRISLFAGGCTLEAVTALCGSQGDQEVDIFALLSGLLGHSLLRQKEPDADEPRFVLLESVQEYALERLREQNEIEAARRAHALYYLALIEQAFPYLMGSQQAPWLARLDLEKDNLRAALLWLLNNNEVELALRFCEGFGKFCGLRGYWAEEWRWLLAVLALPVTPALRGLRARILRRAGHLAYRLRNLSIARIWQEESIELAQEAEDQSTLAGALVGLGWTLYRQNEITPVEQLLHKSVEVALVSGDKWILASTLHSSGRFLHYQDRTTEARLLLEQSLALMRELVDADGLVRTLTSLISLELAQGNSIRAKILAQESFSIAQEVGSKPILALALDNLANVALFQGDHSRAADFLARRILQAEEIGDPATMARKRLQLGTIEIQRKDFARAEALAQQGLLFFQSQGDETNKAVALDLLAKIEYLRAQPLPAKKRQP